MSQETNNALGERIARLEEMQRAAANRAAEDRSDMKEKIAELRDDIATVKTDVSAISASIKTAVDQITGGRKTLHFLYWIGGASVVVAGYATGLFKWLSAMPLPR
jgi:uncharacterized coiled-coil DUF342 family protein